jgi:hypothetical protein
MLTQTQVQDKKLSKNSNEKILCIGQMIPLALSKKKVTRRLP